MSVTPRNSEPGAGESAEIPWKGAAALAAAASEPEAAPGAERSPGGAEAGAGSARSGGWRRFTAGFARVLDWLLVATVAVLIVPVTMQIVSRYTDLIPPYIWTEELARFVFIWMIMLGAMIGVREGSHFDVDIWPRLGARADAALKLVGNIATLGFALVFVWSGYEFTAFAIYRTSELADLPLWLIHMAWPMTGIAWIVFLGEKFVDNLRVLSRRHP